MLIVFVDSQKDIYHKDYCAGADVYINCARTAGFFGPSIPLTPQVTPQDTLQVTPQEDKVSTRLEFYKTPRGVTK